MPKKRRKSRLKKKAYSLPVVTIALAVVGACVCLSLVSCVTSPPTSLNNLCDIFEEKGGWYKAAKKSRERWNTPIPVMMAIVHQESRFVAKAKPPRKKFLWIFPGPRVSSAFGYSQAKKSTWEWYLDVSGNRGADRDDFEDAIDFVGWYNNVSHKQNNIAFNDARNLYLAYHEGHGGFNRRTYRNKTWLVNVANKVGSRSQRYGQQLARCEEDLDSSWWPF